MVLRSLAARSDITCDDTFQKRFIGFWYVMVCFVFFLQFDPALMSGIEGAENCIFADLDTDRWNLRQKHNPRLPAHLQFL